MSTVPQTSLPPVRVRFIGTPESVAVVLDLLTMACFDVTTSRLYPTRDRNGHVRVYADITPAPPATTSEE
ncbi:hypothetical protein [Nocardia flavorosea]|uniref:hypothetical protein n=1 Tax=Nocardia flavorosea TaxID=53429 RepID=UPI002453BADA|nr:hypothetical protein [Nocardia flavorosea]